MLLSILKTVCNPGVPFGVVTAVLNSHGGTEAAWSLLTSCIVYSFISPTWLVLQARLETCLVTFPVASFPQTAMELFQLFFKLFSTLSTYKTTTSLGTHYSYPIKWTWGRVCMVSWIPSDKMEFWSRYFKINFNFKIVQYCHSIFQLCSFCTLLAHMTSLKVLIKTTEGTMAVSYGP